jgi:hypothetical protein
VPIRRILAVDDSAAARSSEAALARALGVEAAPPAAPEPG